MYKSAFPTLVVIPALTLVTLTLQVAGSGKDWNGRWMVVCLQITNTNNQRQLLPSLRTHRAKTS